MIITNSNINQFETFTKSLTYQAWWLFDKPMHHVKFIPEHTNIVKSLESSKMGVFRSEGDMLLYSSYSAWLNSLGRETVFICLLSNQAKTIGRFMQDFNEQLGKSLVSIFEAKFECKTFSLPYYARESLRDRRNKTVFFMLPRAFDFRFINGHLEDVSLGSESKIFFVCGV